MHGLPAGAILACVDVGMQVMEPEECRELALLYREVAQETHGPDKEGLLAIAVQLEEMADEEDGGPYRTIH